ncbi:MAG: hypothetical protein WKF68_12005 [Daejeonella sp.]
MYSNLDYERPFRIRAELFRFFIKSASCYGVPFIFNTIFDFLQLKKIFILKIPCWAGGLSVSGGMGPYIENSRYYQSERNGSIHDAPGLADSLSYEEFASLITYLSQQK